MKIRNLLFNALITIGFLCLIQGCKKDYDVQISDKHRSDIPQGVQLLDHTSKTLTVAWDYIDGATSYVVQLLATPDSENPLYSYVTHTEDYYIFSNLEPRKSYYARVRANFANSATSDWSYVTLNDQTAKIIPIYGMVDQSFEIPYFKIIDSSSSTITAEWSFTGFDNPDSELGDTYAIYLYNDAEGKDLEISWEELSGLFATSTSASPKPLRFTFSGLTPDKNYYLKVVDKTTEQESPLRKTGTTPAIAAAVTNAQKSGDIALSQDFSKFVHGGDILFKAAGYTVGSAAGRASWSRASGANPVDEQLGQAPCNLTTEFNVFDGGNVTPEYTKGAGMEGWGKQGNTSTRPGYIKIGGSNALAALYTPELSNLAATSDLTVSFKAGVYNEGGIDYCDQILVQAVRGAEFNAKGAISNSDKVDVLAAELVNIQEAKEGFKSFSVDLKNIPKDARIVFSSDPAGVAGNKTRFLLDDVKVQIK